MKAAGWLEHGKVKRCANEREAASALKPSLPQDWGGGDSPGRVCPSPDASSLLRPSHISRRVAARGRLNLHQYAIDQASTSLTSRSTTPAGFDSHRRISGHLVTVLATIILNVVCSKTV